MVAGLNRSVAHSITRSELGDRCKNIFGSALIKQHTLQDTQDRRQIKADAALKQVLGRDQVSMFELPKLLNQHVSAAQP